MTTSELIALLSNFPGGAETKAWDPDSEEYESITGCVWEDGGSCVFVQTDEL